MAHRSTKRRGFVKDTPEEDRIEVPIDELWGEEEVEEDVVKDVVKEEVKVLPFLEGLKISKGQKVALSEELIRKGYSNPKGTVNLLGPGLKGVIGNLYHSVTGRGGAELVEIYQKEYLRMLGPSEKPRH